MSPGALSTNDSASTPSCARARGLALSTTMSARSRIRCSWRRPEGSPKSSATLDFPALRSAKNSGGPERAPSVRRVLSSFTTRAPASSRRWVQSGPAQSEERSTTSGSSDRARVTDLPRAATRHQGGATAGGSTATAAASPRSRARATISAAGRSATRLATNSQGSATSPSPSQAGIDLRSSGRGRLMAIHPSVAWRMRQLPPGETTPRRARPKMAARSPRRAGPSRSDDQRSPATRRIASNAARAQVASGPGARTGGPSAWPVRAIAPESAHSMAGWGSLPFGERTTRQPSHSSSDAV